MPRKLGDRSCSVCDKPMWTGNGTLPQGKATCRDCRKAARTEVHGTRLMYRERKCRCVECRAWCAEAQREYAAQYRARTGRSLRREYARPESISTWISGRQRAEIYERDRWKCQICGDAVDPALNPSDRMAATLDHVECQSWALFPDHSPANLRLAHRSCNSSRGARAA